MRTLSVAKKKDDNITRLNVLAYSHALLIIDEWLLYSLKETEAGFCWKSWSPGTSETPWSSVPGLTSRAGWKNYPMRCLPMSPVTKLFTTPTLYYHLRMELIFDEDEVTEEQKKEILRLSKAEKGISREYLIRSGANLKNLHYAMRECLVGRIAPHTSFQYQMKNSIN